ncbi:MAG: sigma-70 family RNA polymerase sigma factor [Saprospiraceae bacterium]|nr:sigma-70 family RNA polymerase sigma factor [Saprospiraceae bacterium]
MVNGLQAGDEQTFAALYDAYGDMLFGIIFRIVGDQKETENLLQDCFVKIWRNVGRFDPQKGRLATWLINIARNTAIDFTRSKYFSQVRKNQSLENTVGIKLGSKATQMPVDTIGLKKLVERLSPGCREVIEWMYFEGYTQQEIADNFGIPLGTVKSRTRLALKELRAYFCDN